MNTRETSQEVFAGYLILLVDDSVDNIEVLQELFEFNGAEVITAHSGRDGLELAKRHPDMIITDLAMPGMTGFEMLSSLKSDRELAEIPVIALTGHALESYRTAAFEAGCLNVLVKPLSPTVIFKEVLDLLTHP